MREDFENLIAALNAPSPDVVFVMSPSPTQPLRTSVLPSSFPLHPSSRLARVPTSTVVAVDRGGRCRCDFGRTTDCDFVKTRRSTKRTQRRWRLGTVGSPDVVAAPMRAAFQTDVALWCASSPTLHGRPGRAPVAAITTVGM